MSQVLNLVQAYDNFIKGCKSDGTWDAIKASCIMAGWDGLNGAITPLKGTAPTNFNFVSGDYNRKTGLVGNGSTKYLDSNRNNNADPQDSKHFSFYLSALNTVALPVAYIGGDAISGSSQAADTTNQLSYRINSDTAETLTGIAYAIGLTAFNRNGASTTQHRSGGASGNGTQSSTSPTNESLLLYRRGNVVGTNYVNARISFYSIGESINLAALDSRVSTLMTSINSAIP